MKVKTKVIILVSVCLIILVGAIFGDRLLKKAYFKEAKAHDVVEMIKNKEDFILLVGQTTCSHCINYKPKLESVANEYKIKVYYIEADLFSDEESQAFSEYISYTSTPSTIFIRNGEEKTVASRIIGDASISKIKSKLKANGWIK